jgi:hypothetical protein
MSGILQLNTLSNEEMDEKIDINISSVSIESSLIHKTKKTVYRGNVSLMNLTPYGKVVKDNYEMTPIQQQCRIVMYVSYQNCNWMYF